MTDAEHASEPRLVLGAGGSGKTHVLDQIATRALDAGVTVVRVAGDPGLPDVCLLARALGEPHAGGAADPAALLDLLCAALGVDGMVVADDVHHLDDTSLTVLRLHADQGGIVVAATRPHVGRPALADLLHSLGRTPSLRLDGLDHDALAAAVAAWLATPAATDLVDAVLELSGGSPGLAHDLVVGGFTDPGGDLPRGVVDRVLVRVQRLGGAVAAVANAMAMSHTLPDAVVAELAGLEPAELAPTLDELRAAGLAEPDDDRLVPMVALALAASWAPAEARRRHGATADALLRAGIDDSIVATHLREASATGEAAAQIFVRAGDRIRWTDPVAAVGWYEYALTAGALPSATAVGRAEAGLATGAGDVRILVDQLDRDDPAQRARARVVLAAIDLADARPDRAAARLLDPGDHPEVAPDALRCLAVPLLVSLGSYDEARTVFRSAQLDDLDATQRLAALVASAALAGLDGADPVPRFIEAAELAESTPLPLPSLLTPHALAASHAELVGDFAVGESLLTRAVERGIGGPAVATSHQLLQAWIRFRQGRHDTAARLVAELDRRTLVPRDALVVAALDAGLARRTGDVARLQDCWAGVEAALLRQTVDLTTFGPVGELVVAASRLGQADRADAVQRQLDQIIDRRNPAVPAGWRAALGWHHIQLAVVTDDAVAAGTAAVELETLPTPEGERPATFARAVTAAARCWADLLLESVDIDAIGAAVDLLNDALLPWDAARLAGQAALRVTDPSAARSLLERARTLKTPLPDPDVTRAVDSPLSEREQEVATFLVDGLTYKEIGAQLYISAKTVEHHVARIRQKLGAGSRAELLAALRDFV